MKQIGPELEFSSKGILRIRLRATTWTSGHSVSDFDSPPLKKGKAEHLYSALRGIQTTLKRSGMDHTAFNLQRTPCQPLPRKR